MYVITFGELISVMKSGRFQMHARNKVELLIIVLLLARCEGSIVVYYTKIDTSHVLNN